MARDIRQPMVVRKAVWKLDLVSADEEDASSIVVIRNSLKNLLMYDRGELTAAGWLPICPICGEPVQTPDMHEAIITRGDVRRLPVGHQVMIFVRENCVLVHPGQCHILGATTDGTRKCIHQLLNKEGLKAVVEWLTTIGSVLPQGLLNEALSLVQHNNEKCQIGVWKPISPTVGEIGARPIVDLPEAKVKLLVNPGKE